MLDEQDDPINRYYQSIVKIEQKLNNHLQNLSKLVKSNETTTRHHRNQQQIRNREKNILEYENKIEKFVNTSNRQIESIYGELQLFLEENNDLETRYAILADSKKQITQTITNLKQELHDNKSSISKYKKLENIVNSLTTQLKLEQSSVNKLQLAYNNSLRLQNDMEAKIRELQHQENQSSARYQWQNQREIQGEGFWKNSQKYQKLAEAKTDIFKKLQEQVKDFNKNYLEKFTNLSSLKTKIKGIDEIYEELQVNVGEQELIIKEILIKQGLSSSYLLQITKKENEDLNQSDEDQTPKNIQKSIDRFRRKMGLPNSSNPNNSKFHTEPSLHTEELQPINKSGQNVNKIMRMTTKMPQSSLPQRVKRSSLQHQSSLGRANKISKKPIKEAGSMSIFLPPIENNDDESYFPISHNSHTPTRNVNKRKAKGSYSHQITHSKMFRNVNSHIPSENEDMLPMENHFVRIRTKGGYIYKNIDDHDNYTSREDRGNRSEIVNLYQKLSHKLGSNKCVCDEGKINGNRKYQSQYERFMTQSQAEKAPQAYAKLSKSRKKVKQQSNKKMMEARQSDPDNQKWKLKLNIDSQQVDKEKNNNKNEDKEEDESKIQTRRRLNTIHEGEQHAQESRNNNK